MVIKRDESVDVIPIAYVERATSISLPGIGIAGEFPAREQRLALWTERRAREVTSVHILYSINLPSRVVLEKARYRC